jgi:hypothetical protein
MVFRTRIADPRGVVVDQIPLEFSDLFVCEDDLRELADAGVDPVHDLASLDALVEKVTATDNPVAGIGMELDTFAVAGDRNDVFDCEVVARN